MNIVQLAYKRYIDLRVNFKKERITYDDGMVASCSSTPASCRFYSSDKTKIVFILDIGNNETNIVCSYCDFDITIKDNKLYDFFDNTNVVTKIEDYENFNDFHNLLEEEIFYLTLKYGNDIGFKGVFNG